MRTGNAESVDLFIVTIQDPRPVAESIGRWHRQQIQNVLRDRLRMRRRPIGCCDGELEGNFSAERCSLLFRELVKHLLLKRSLLVHGHRVLSARLEAHYVKVQPPFQTMAMSRQLSPSRLQEIATTHEIIVYRIG